MTRTGRVGVTRTERVDVTRTTRVGVTRTERVGVTKTERVAVSTHKGVNKCSKYVTQVQQQRPESHTVTLTWHARKYTVHKLHQRYIRRCTSLFT